MGQTPFLQACPRAASCTTSAMRCCRGAVPKGLAPALAMGHSKGKVGGTAGDDFPLAWSDCSRQGLIPTGAVACRRCHTEDALRPPRRLFAELVTVVARPGKQGQTEALALQARRARGATQTQLPSSSVKRIS